MIESKTPSRLRATVELVLLLAALTAPAIALSRMGGLPTLGAIRDAIALRTVPGRLAIQTAAAISWIAIAYVVAWSGADIALRTRGVGARQQPRWIRPVTDGRRSGTPTEGRPNPGTRPSSIPDTSKPAGI